jgi:serine/threonine protein kinase
MGLVFVAEQRQPVRRKVALKVIKPGMDSRQIVARFEAERQALALMDHPHIAKIYDGGATTSGRPYFVMELVKGAPITTFCDDNQLDRAPGSICSSTFAKRCNTRIKRGSSTGTSSRPTCSWRPATARRWSRSSTSASPKPSSNH